MHDIPAIQLNPPRYCWNGHLETLIAFYFPGSKVEANSAERHIVDLNDGDRLVLHDDRPPTWNPGDRTALLIHGLAGCHRSPYMVRIARKLNDRGVRTFRMDLRGCGAGITLARMPYHAGRSEDAAAALRTIEQLCPSSPTCIIGFSLGGNITLKLVGESPASLPSHVSRAIALSPPIDISHCSRSLMRMPNRLYDRYFVKLLWRHLHRRRKMLPDLPIPPNLKKPKSIRHFDEVYTAPICGFGTAENYYAKCSSEQFLKHIRIPTLILAATNDPMVPIEPFRRIEPNPALRVGITNRGGHLGFLCRAGLDPDRYWMDWRVIEWALSD